MQAKIATQRNYTTLQNEKAVSFYLTGKQILPFGFAPHLINMFNLPKIQGLFSPGK